MKIISTLLTVSMLSAGWFTDNFFKYSTFYGSGSISSPLASTQKISFSTGDGITDELHEVPYNYNYSFGVRKMARFKYQTKKGNFYDGSEKEHTDMATLGAVTGFECLLKYSDVRMHNNKYRERDYWIRYVGSSYVVKLQYSEFGEEQLTYGQADIKYRKSIGNIDFTTGLSFRGRPIVIKPTVRWENNENFPNFWDLAYHMNWTDEYWESEDGSEWDYYWYNPKGELVTDSDQDFYDTYFEGIVLKYYDSLIDDHGWQWEASLAIGADYYNYSNSSWVHIWATVLPYNYGLTNYVKELDRGTDFDLGIVLGWKVSKHFGIFTEGRYLSYFNAGEEKHDHYELKFGMNYVIF